MSTFLAVNGITLPVAQDSVRESIRSIGTDSTAYSGSAIRQRIATKYDLEFETTPMAAATAFAWASLIRGEGQHWSFDSHLYSDKGVGPTNSTGKSIQSSGAGPKHGANYLYVSAGNNFVTNDVCSGTTATTILWRYYSAAWHHYIILGNASSVYLDGVLDATSIAGWFTLSSGDLTIGNDQSFDDLVVLPFTIPTDWVSSIYSFHGSNAWSSIPRLTLTGDAIWEASSRSAVGFCESSSMMSGYLTASFAANIRKLSVLFKGA